MKQQIFYIESSYTGAGELMIRRAIERGIKPCLLTKDTTPYHFIDDYPELDVIIADTTDEELLSSLIQSRAIGTTLAIATTDDYSVSMVARLQKRLGLKGNAPEKALVCRNKSHLRAMLSKLAPELSVNHWSIPANGCLGDLPKHMTFPLIIKPSSYTGSIGIKLCHDANELQAHLDKYRCYIPPGSEKVCNDWLVEEVIQGQEFSAEFLDGHCIGLTQKYKTPAPHFVEVGHVFPAPLDCSLASHVQQRLEQLIQQLQLTCGPLHLEFFLTDEANIKVVEINGRLPGDRIPVLIKLATGLDIFDQYLDSLFGHSKLTIPEIHTYAGIRFELVNEIGTVNSIVATAGTAVQSSQWSERPPSHCESNLDRCGFVILSDERCTVLTQLMKVEQYVAN